MEEANWRQLPSIGERTYKLCISISMGAQQHMALAWMSSLEQKIASLLNFFPLSEVKSRSHQFLCI